MPIQEIYFMEEIHSYMKVNETKELFQGKKVEDFKEEDWESITKTINDKYINQVVASRDKIISDLKSEKEKALKDLNSSNQKIVDESKKAEDRISQMEAEIKAIKDNNEYLKNTNYLKSINSKLNDYQVNAVLNLAKNERANNPDMKLEDSIKNAITNLGLNETKTVVTLPNASSHTDLPDKKAQEDELKTIFSYRKGR